MSNIERATHIINETYADEYVRPHMTPPKVAQALADTTPPLLMPDLPEPDRMDPEPFNNEGLYPVWETALGDASPNIGGGVTIGKAGRVEGLSLWESSQAAYALLAAANYAEKHAKNP